MLAAVAALAADGFAVDIQSVHQHLRMRAICFGALPIRTVVANQGAVAMWTPGQTFAAFVPWNFSCHAFLSNTAGCSGSVAAPFVAGSAALGSGDRPTGSRCHQTASHHVPIERPMTCRRLPARVAALWFPPASSAAAAVLISARLPTDFMYCARRFSLSRHANGFSYRWSPVRFSRTYRSPTAIRSGSGCCFSLSAWPPARC